MANSQDTPLSEEDKVRFKLLHRIYAISKGYKFVPIPFVNFLLNRLLTNYFKSFPVDIELIWDSSPNEASGFKRLQYLNFFFTIVFNWRFG
jgi:hypothetical protein